MKNKVNAIVLLLMWVSPAAAFASCEATIEVTATPALYLRAEKS
jgi:hypothetical protein